MSSNNPFFDEGNSGGGFGNEWEDLGKEKPDYDPNADYGFDFQGSSKQEQIERRKQNMLDSTHRSMGLVCEAEYVGNETAAELLHQGEQLRRVDAKLDKMDKDLDTSKKHITSMKSIFGGIVNYFNKPKQPPPQTDAPPPRGPSQLETHVERMKAEEEMRREQSEHPALRIRSGAGYDSGGGATTAGFGVEASGGYGGGWQSDGMKEFDNQINTNLDEISGGISRLKGLAMGLGDELERQNDDIDRIDLKTQRVDEKLVKTDKDVKKILRR